MAYPCDFRVRIHDRRNGVVVDVAIALGDIFNSRDGFFFSLVREHGPESAVANNADVGKLSAVLLVDHQTAFFIDLEANILKAETSGVWATTDGYQNNVRLELGALISLDLVRKLAGAYRLLLSAFGSFGLELKCLPAVVSA